MQRIFKHNGGKAESQSQKKTIRIVGGGSVITTVLLELCI